MYSMDQANLPAAPGPQKLLGDIRTLIESARGQMARAANAGLVKLYWSVGRRIRQDILTDKRAEYGKQIVATLSQQLVPEYGHGFSLPALFRMMRCAEVFPDPRIFSTLSRKLGWSHLSRKPADLAALELKKLREQDKLTPDLVFRDPYLLDFLGLKGAYQEKDMESAILRELERFLIELGGDFAFVARQKRITIDQEDYYIDLLFYHRGLRRLVAIELKLDKHERRLGEESPLGLILCAKKSPEHVELLELEKSGIRIAQYMTDLPAKSVLESKLHQAIRLARERLSAPPAASHPSA